MTAQSVTGIGSGSAEGPLRGFDLDNLKKVYIVYITLERRLYGVKMVR